MTIKVKAEEKTYIKICDDRADKENGCYIEIPDTEGEYMEITTEYNKFSGVKDLYFVFAGNVNVLSWHFE